MSFAMDLATDPVPIDKVPKLDSAKQSTDDKCNNCAVRSDTCAGITRFRTGSGAKRQNIFSEQCLQGMPGGWCFGRI